MLVQSCNPLKVFEWNKKYKKIIKQDRLNLNELSYRTHSIRNQVIWGSICISDEN